MLVQDGEARKCACLPGAEVGAGRVDEQCLGTEVCHGHRRRDDLGARELRLFDGLRDVVAFQVDLPGVVGRHVAHVAHGTCYGRSIAGEHEVATEFRVRLLCLPAEQLAVEPAASFYVRGPKVGPAWRSDGGTFTGGHGGFSSFSAISVR